MTPEERVEAVPGYADRCNATPEGYDIEVYCEREAGHGGSRHWCDRLNWPA